MVVKRANYKELLRDAVPLKMLDDRRIPLSEMQRQDIPLSFLLSRYSLPEFVNRLDADDRWTQLVAMGLTWQDLKDRTKMPPEVIGMHVKPTPTQFLALFRDAEVEKPERTSAEIESAMRNDTPLSRFVSVGYTAMELAALGLREKDLCDVLGARPEDLYRQVTFSAEEERDQARESALRMARVRAARQKTVDLELEL